MSKKTVINIENLNVSGLPASFYQGTFVNRGPSEMYEEEDENDEVCHCCVCEDERREEAEAHAEEDSCDGCNEEFTQDEAREIRQDAHIINQGLGLNQLDHDFREYVAASRQQFYNYSNETAMMILRLQRDQILQDKKIKELTVLVNTLTDKSAKVVVDPQSTKTQDESTIKSFSSFLKEKLVEEEEAKDSGKYSRKLTEKHIQEMAKHKSPTKANMNSIVAQQLEELSKSKKSKHFSDTDRNK